MDFAQNYTYRGACSTGAKSFTTHCPSIDYSSASRRLGMKQVEMNTMKQQKKSEIEIVG